MKTTKSRQTRVDAPTRFDFDGGYPPPEPPGLGTVEVGVETRADGSRLMTIAAIAPDGSSTLVRLNERLAVRLQNDVANRQFLAWPMAKPDGK